MPIFRAVRRAKPAGHDAALSKLTAFRVISIAPQPRRPIDAHVALAKPVMRGAFCADPVEEESGPGIVRRYNAGRRLSPF